MFTMAYTCIYFILIYAMKRNCMYKYMHVNTCISQNKNLYKSKDQTSYLLHTNQLHQELCYQFYMQKLWLLTYLHSGVVSLAQDPLCPPPWPWVTYEVASSTWILLKQRSTAEQGLDSLEQAMWWCTLAILRNSHGIPHCCPAWDPAAPPAAVWGLGPAMLLHTAGLCSLLIPVDSGSW
jgi:hypothetical protein